jgi:hypothetical protein
VSPAWNIPIPVSLLFKKKIILITLTWGMQFSVRHPRIISNKGKSRANRSVRGQDK